MVGHGVFSMPRIPQCSAHANICSRSWEAFKVYRIQTLKASNLMKTPTPYSWFVAHLFGLKYRTINAATTSIHRLLSWDSSFWERPNAKFRMRRSSRLISPLQPSSMHAGHMRAVQQNGNRYASCELGMRSELTTLVKAGSTRKNTATIG